MLVTGGTQGIGLAIAKRFARAGVRLAISGRRETADDVLDRLRASATATIYRQSDVGDAAACDKLLADVVAEFGGLDTLICNAGIAINGLLMRVKDDDLQRQLQTNVVGAFNVCRAALRHLLKAKAEGRIVLISSVVGEQGSAGQAAYATSKAALLGLMRSIAREVAGRGVTVNAISPGFIETAMTEAHVTETRREQLISQIPLGRIGTPDDVAASVEFLCSPEAGYITGQVLRVNGGLYM